jgi:acetyl-CoA carboxylase carboxyl transferase subunit beta
MDVEKRIHELNQRLHYIRDIFGAKENANIALLDSKLAAFVSAEKDLPSRDLATQLNALEDLFSFLENKLDRALTPMDRVRIVRHPLRICLKDILENVYDNYSEIGGQDEYSIDPSMLIARAYISRRVGKKLFNQPVMVIGQEKGHGQEFRNGGSVKPWGNAKALHYMRVAETENIPIHTYVFTPGAYPVEDYPGAAQQIARNLYEIGGLRVPIVAVFSEGGSGGAEAIGLADIRLMLSHGYYSVISPEGAAAIEGRLREGMRATPELIEKCARQLKITAGDNLEMGLIDHVIQEPPLGARPNHYNFFKQLRGEVIRATDEIVLSVRGMRMLRSESFRRRKTGSVYVRWNLNTSAKERLVWRRYSKYRAMAQTAYIDRRKRWERSADFTYELCWSVYSFLRHDILGKHQKRFANMMEDLEAEMHILKDRVSRRLERIKPEILTQNGSKENKVLTELSPLSEADLCERNEHCYLSPLAKEDRTISCPNAEESGCLDQWAPDLFGEWAGVCSSCGHHFPMEYEWYLNNVFDPGSIHEFNRRIEAGNPLGYEGLDLKLAETKKKLGHRSACMTFEARIQNINVVVAVLMAKFRGGSVGAAEGEKFIRAAERARKKHLPFIAYVHGTAGIRIQEGTNGVIQMPRCTMAVRRYMEAGGLYVVIYDTNSYAGPVASFLGCSPYQFSVRSANIGFAGPGVIKETTSIDIPPDYHKAYYALSRGHIQGIWDRREIRNNLQRALMTMGGRNLYYR